MNTQGALQFAFLFAGLWLGGQATVLGRVVAGWLVGFRLSRVELGSGPVLGIGRLGKTAFVWHAMPTGVGVDWLPPARETAMRLRLWLLTLGGILGCLALVIVFFALGHPPHEARTPTPHSPLPAVGIGAVLYLALRLLPISVTQAGKKVPTEGKQLWTIPTAAQKQIDMAFVHSYMSAAQLEIAKGDPNDALEYCRRAIERCDPQDVRVFRYFEGAAYGRLGDFARAKARMEESFAADLPEPLRGIAHNDWSWYAFCVRDEADLRLADRRSAEALGVHAKRSSVLGTRGSILLWRGRVTQAIPMLERSYRTASSRRSRGEEAHLLAMAFASRGESERAQQMLDIATRLHPDGHHAAEAARYVRAATTSLRVLYAAHGSRALLVEPDGIELLEGVVAAADDPVQLKTSAALRKRLTLSEIDELSVGRGRSGRAHLVVRYAGRAWRLPLDAADLTWARMLADDVLNHPPLPEATPPSVVPGSDRVTRWLPAIGAAALLPLFLGLPALSHLMTFAALAAIIAIATRPGVAAALATGTSALIAAVGHSYLYPFVSWTRSLAEEGLPFAIAAASFVGAWFSARERRGSDGIRLTRRLLTGALVLDGLIFARFWARGVTYHALDLFTAAVTLGVVSLWSARRRQVESPASPDSPN